MIDFITGEKFYDIADFIYSSDSIEHGHEDYNKLNNTFDINKLNDINIVYLHTMYKEQFFRKIKNTDKKFIIITHNSDLDIKSVDDLPSNVIKWFAQNVDVVDERVESIPIGLENEKWFRHLKKKECIQEKLKEEKNFKNLLYMNHNVNTNKSERFEPYKILSSKKWVTAIMGVNGQNFNGYLDSIYNHKFIVSPRGNGIDTHRKWEALYLNTIPIEKRNINNTFYEDLPICFIDSWEQVTEDFLNKEYERITNTEWNLDKLKMSYWREKILNFKNENK